MNREGLTSSKTYEGLLTTGHFSGRVSFFKGVRPSKSTTPVGGTTPKSIWAAQTVLGGCENKTEDLRMGEGGQTLDELGEDMEKECDQNALCICKNFSNN